MTQLTLVTATGEEHGLIKKMANSVSGDGFSHMTPERKAEAQKKKKEDSRTVKARYLNTRGKHERLTMPYSLGAGEPIQMWHFIPGHVYDVPNGLIQQVNSKRPIIREGKCDENGDNPSKKDAYDEPLHQFVPAAF
jgi:hypothetical protein